MAFATAGLRTCSTPNACVLPAALWVAFRFAHMFSRPPMAMLVRRASLRSATIRQ